MSKKKNLAFKSITKNLFANIEKTKNKNKLETKTITTKKSVL